MDITRAIVLDHIISTGGAFQDVVDSIYFPAKQNGDGRSIAQIRGTIKKHINVLETSGAIARKCIRYNETYQSIWMLQDPRDIVAHKLK
jgi:hypothetical protein